MENVINFDLLKEYDGTLKEVLKVWRKQKSYSIDDIIQYKGNYLKCITAGTSGTTTLNFTGLDVGDTITDGTVIWEIIEPPSGGGVDLPEWQANTSYTTGKYLVHEGTVYKVDNDFTSGTTFSDANLTSYIAPIMEGATSSTDGKAGMVIKPTTTDVDKFLKGDGTWGSAGGGISIWQANTVYSVNDVVIDSNLIWQCATAHTSTITFDESKWICISGGEISNGYEIVSLWKGIGNTLNQVLTLPDNYTNYEYILGTMADGNGVVFASNILETVSGYGLYIMGVLSNGGVKRAYLQFSSNQATILEATGLDSSKYVSELRGIRKAKPIVSSGMKYETLWEGEAGNLSGSGSTTITLNEPISKYQKIGFTIKTKPGTETTVYYREIDVENYFKFINGVLSADHIGFYEGYSNFDDYVEINTGSTNTQVVFSYGKSSIVKVIGISEGVVIPTGVQAARVTLWEGLYNTVNSPLHLSDSIDNYDQFELTLSNDGTSERGTFTYNVKDIDYSGYDFRIYNAQDTTYRYSMSVSFVDSTNFRIDNLTVSGWSTAYLTKITGIKYIQPDSYSTEEKLIGTWIDGKPLYRIVIDTPNIPYNTGLTSSNCSIKKVFAHGHDASGATYDAPYTDGTSFITYFVLPSDGILNRSGNLSSYVADYVIIEYTKN